MANGKIVKYKKVYKITIEGKTDTSLPDEEPIALLEAKELLISLTDYLNSHYKWRDVTIKELKR